MSNDNQMKGHKPNKKDTPYIPFGLQSPNLNIGDDNVNIEMIEVLLGAITFLHLLIGIWKVVNLLFLLVGLQ